MANFGFISMAPAITAVAEQVTVVDGIVDDILEDTDATIPEALAVVDGIVDDILVDTDATIPEALAVVDGIVDGIVNDTNVVIPTAIGILGDQHAALAAEHVVIDGIVENILVDTDATIPAAIAAIPKRGQVLSGADDTTSNVHVIMLDVSGSGIIYQIYLAKGVAGIGYMKVTVDGKPSNFQTVADDLGKYFAQVAYVKAPTPFKGFVHALDDENTNLLHIEFKTQFRIEIRSNDVNAVYCGWLYGGD